MDAPGDSSRSTMGNSGTTYQHPRSPHFDAIRTIAQLDQPTEDQIPDKLLRSLVQQVIGIARTIAVGAEADETGKMQRVG